MKAAANRSSWKPSPACFPAPAPRTNGSPSTWARPGPSGGGIPWRGAAAPPPARLGGGGRAPALPLACGSGACAAAVAAIRRGLTGRTVALDLDGGPIEITWRESDGHVLMTGPVATAFTGTVDLEARGGARA